MWGRTPNTLASDGTMTYDGSDGPHFHGEVTWWCSQAWMLQSLPEASELFNVIG